MEVAGRGFIACIVRVDPASVLGKPSEIGGGGMNTSPAPRQQFTEKSLPLAIGNLFQMNNYDVQYDIHVHGAQVDIVARSKADPFSLPVYIEATVEYVSTEKYGKDSTKFLLLARKEPGATLLCVSSVGFTASVKERAEESGVVVLSYDELFARFEKFTPYLNLALNDIDTAKLVSTYEEPNFNDSKGHESATKWLSYWKGFSPDESKWLIILGEYGTGKTSLTKILQNRWLKEYHANPTHPIPVRIELRNFSRQFDAKGLLHHFLDTNYLSHVPIEFMNHLIKTGRVILLLDGYDEMAQFMNARERRACLSALAELASDGAKGILTSRPNYFSETEELNVFEALYRTLEQQQYHVSKLDGEFIAQEKSVDELVERYVLNRYERSLQDLTPEQTEALVRRSLSKDEIGQQLVLSILKKVFREEAKGSKQALSGKPVIIAYLLELVEEIRKESLEIDASSLTEWQVYKLIIDRLMLRDLRRSTLNPADRRRVLQKLALRISLRDQIVATERTFQEIIDEEFQAELRRLPTDERRTRRSELFEDLRSSATLTRATGTKEDGWVFSHNSLREYLAAEIFLQSLSGRSPLAVGIPISAAMRGFVASIDILALESLWGTLGELWPQRLTMQGLGAYLTLLWESGAKLEGGLREALRILGSVGSTEAIPLNDLSLKDLDFNTYFKDNGIRLNASNSTMAESSFHDVDLTGSTFAGAILDTISFRGTNLSSVSFLNAFLFECELTDAIVEGADFTGLEADSTLVIMDADGRATVLSGAPALGYLKYRGATTAPVEDIHVYRNHPKYSIVEKICEKISEQRNSQLRGLTQRGEARVDPPFARDFMGKLQSLGWVSLGRNDLIMVTPAGRPVIQRIVSGEKLPAEIAEFLADRN